MLFKTIILTLIFSSSFAVFAQKTIITQELSVLPNADYIKKYPLISQYRGYYYGNTVKYTFRDNKIASNTQLSSLMLSINDESVTKKVYKAKRNRMLGIFGVATGLTIMVINVKNQNGSTGFFIGAGLSLTGSGLRFSSALTQNKAVKLYNNFVLKNYRTAK